MQTKIIAINFESYTCTLVNFKIADHVLCTFEAAPSTSLKDLWGKSSSPVMRSF